MRSKNASNFRGDSAGKFKMQQLNRQDGNGIFLFTLIFYSATMKGENK